MSNDHIGPRSELPPKESGEVRVAHLSDLHFYSGTSKIRAQVRRLVFRSRTESLEVISSVIDDVLRSDVDHIMITGDVTSSGRTQEFEDARSLLARVSTPDLLSIVPGNHDISYIRRSAVTRPDARPRKLRKFLEYFGHLMPAEHPADLQMEMNGAFPFVKSIGGTDVCLIGLDTTTRVPIKVPALNALGNLSEKQLRELQKLLKAEAMYAKTKIVMMHHHPMLIPFYNWGDSWKGLRKSRRLLDICYGNRVDMIAHGHMHNPFCWQSHTLRRHDFVIVCAGPPNAYAAPLSPNEEALVYNIYSFQGNRVHIHYKQCIHKHRPSVTVFGYGRA